MRQRYIVHPKTGDLIPRDEYYAACSAESGGVTVIPDIQPYRSVITGEIVGGRRQHREHLRTHNCIEVGNERVTPKPLPEVPGRIADIRAAMEKHGVR